jgi:hypothetical protein
MLDDHTITQCERALGTKARGPEVDTVIDLVNRVKAIEKRRKEITQKMSEWATELDAGATEVQSIVTSMKEEVGRWVDGSSVFAINTFEDEVTRM